MRFLILESEAKDIPQATVEYLTYKDYRVVPTIEEAKAKFWFQKWFDGGTNHREEGGNIVCDRIEKSEEYVLEVGSLEELLDIIPWVSFSISKTSSYTGIKYRITESYD